MGKSLKTRHSCQVSLVLTAFLFKCAATKKVNLEFRANIIEDTHITLIGIPFKKEANNSLLFLSLQTYEKKFAEFPFLFISIIPCFD